METPRLCPECRAPLPADAPVGLCPRCLLQQGALRDSASAPTEPPRRHKGPPAAPALAVVAARFPQFEVRQLIGVGGMGAVYEVRQPQLDRIVALKVMLPEVADDPKFAERFTREARALAKLNHPNIVAVYDFGQAGDWFYFVMEFVDGANLRQTMRAGRLTAAQALAIVPKLCDALQFAHDEGIMHRDIKPENILLDKKGRVKIADFGLAKLLGQEPDDHSLTVTGVGMGTPRYMAPEQLDDAKNVDHRADIYSLGVVFYEMLTGELPMGRFATPSEKVQIDVRLDEIVLRSLERDVARRYQHVSEVKTAVENVTSTPGAKAPATPPAATPVPLVPNDEEDAEVAHPFFAWGGRIIALAAVLLAFFNPWGVKAWYFFAAGCAIFGVLSAFGIGRRKTPRSQFPVGADAAPAPLDHRVSQAVTVGLPGWFNRRAPWVQNVIQGVLTIVMMLATGVVLGFSIQSKTNVAAGNLVTNSGRLELGGIAPWFTADFGGTNQGFAIHWLAASLWIGLVGVAAGCLSERLRRSRPGFDEVADRRKRRRWIVVAIIVAVLYVAGLAANVLVMSGATSKATRGVMNRATGKEFSVAQDRSQLPTARTPGRQDYAFTFAGPTNHTLNVWLEVWREGKLEIVDSFDFWARPKLGVPLVASLRLTTMAGNVASVESAGQVRFDWAMNCGGTNGTGMTAGAWRTNIFKNCFSLNSTWDYPPKDGWHPRPGETVTVLALCGYRPDNLSSYDQTWDETSLLKGWPNEAILLRARYNPARAGDLADGPGLGNNFTDRGNIRHTFAQFTIAKVIGVDLGRPANPADAHKLLVAAVATPERQQAVKKMTFQLGAGGAWQNTASPEELITKLEQAIDDVTSKKRIVQAEPGGPLMIGANGPELHADAIKKLKLSKLQADEINRVMQSHHRDYLALERRHSKITKDDQGRIVTTIAPFTDECQALAKRLVAELGGSVEFAILPQPRVGQLPTQIFRWGGEEPQTITMWKTDGKYFVEDKRGTFTFNMSGPNLQDLPEQYRLFWREE